jgi:hypothetical protein
MNTTAGQLLARTALVLLLLVGLPWLGTAIGTWLVGAP